MKPLRVSEGVLSLRAFKASSARFFKDLPFRKTPWRSQNGRPACVVLSPDEFDRMRERQTFLETVAHGLADV